MKFASIYLSNYIGIYNGMGLYEIHIDMSKCKNRITIIRGDNGSGKSTLSKAMSLFPDPTDSFIPGMPARKEIVLVDGTTLYKLSFVHGVTKNGDREPTKAYITKTFGGQIIELNENGNVTSFKDILYSELGLDANFAALSQLSNDDRGLADKRPADRKRFVNSIISSLDVYNAIYKTLTKRSSNYKSMINAIVGKLNVLGDESSLNANLEALESQINEIQNRKDQAVALLAKEQSTVQLLDPDGSIQNTNSVVIAELELAEKEERQIQAIIDSLISDNGIKVTDYHKGYKATVDAKNALIIENQIARNSIDSLMSQKESEAEELSAKIQKLNHLQNGYEYEILREKAKEYENEIKAIEEAFYNIGITDLSSINKEEYILALETLKDLDRYISTFKDSVRFEILESIVNEYMETGKIPERKNPSLINREIKNAETEINSCNIEKASVLSKMDLLDKLKLRPESCSDNTCPFIKDAIEFSHTNPTERIDSLDALVYSLQGFIKLENDKLTDLEEYNNAINQFAIIIREIDKNGAILSKMPEGEMFSNKAIFFGRLVQGYSFEYMKHIYKYIDMANMFDTYKCYKEFYNNCMEKIKSFEGKLEIIVSLNEDIESINKTINAIMDKIDPINKEILEREIKIAQLQELEGVYNAIITQLEKKKPIESKIAECRSKLLDNNRKMNDISAALARAEAAKENINQCNFALGPLMKERDKVSHSVQMMKDYLTEKEELQANYDFIETIKYYSSPTTGIQLVFMELYMGKIIALANELLSLLFNGQFKIQPFVINESEFRIPCLGNGYLNDDISSMSSSQIGMISMILSFALLHHSSSKYNIIKLDEIDGPLDYNNRMYFTEVLNSIMDIMGTEQCIMISHNSELQIDNSDVILLRHDENNMDYERGNVIWRFQ